MRPLAERLAAETRAALIEALSAADCTELAAGLLGVSRRTVFRLMAEHLSEHDRDVIAKARENRSSLKP